MFNCLFESVESHFPDQDARLTPEEHKAILDQVFSRLSDETEPLLGAAQAILGNGIFETSRIGFEYSVTKPDKDGLLNPPIQLAEMYVRPARDKHDISLNISVARGYTTQQQILEPAVDLELEIRELTAKVTFETLYKDYRAQIGRLLEQAQIKFFTSYCSNIAKKSLSRKISAELDEYFSAPQADCWFTLSLRCSPGTPYAEGIQGFLALSLLYAACRAGLKGKGDRSVFEKNLAKLI